MKIAVLADIHSNILALNAVLEDVKKEGITKLLIAGDLVGYYYHPVEVLKTLKEWDCEIIQGNHDTIDWLKDLPKQKLIKTDGGDILLCHGSPWNRDYYVYPDASEYTIACCAVESIVIMGHTHYSMVKRIRGSLIINPGSVGQPRDGKSSWAVLDLNKMTVEIRTFTYDVGSVIAEAKRNNPEIPFLAEVFKR